MLKLELGIRRHFWTQNIGDIDIDTDILLLWFLAYSHTKMLKNYPTFFAFDSGNPTTSTL